MNRSGRAILLPLLAAVLVLVAAGCSAGEPAKPDRLNGEDGEQPGPGRPLPGDPEYGASILLPDFWGEGVLLEGNPEMGYFMLGFTVPAGTRLYAPFDGMTGVVNLEDYGSGEEDNTEAFKGRSLCTSESLNGFSAYNVTGTVEGAIQSGEVFARVSSDRHIFPKYYGKVNLILEFNLFDVEAAEYAELRTLFGKIFDTLLQDEGRASR